MYISQEDHGGSCCGISHLHGFPVKGAPAGKIIYYDENRNYIVGGRNTEPEKVWDEERVATRLKSLMQHTVRVVSDCDEDEDCKGFTHLFEVVLAGNQIDDWRSAVEAAGFRQVNEFLNSNSGNDCYVFHCIYEGE